MTGPWLPGGSGAGQLATRLAQLDRRMRVQERAPSAPGSGEYGNRITALEDAVNHLQGDVDELQDGAQIVLVPDLPADGTTDAGPAIKAVLAQIEGRTGLHSAEVVVESAPGRPVFINSTVQVESDFTTLRFVSPVTFGAKGRVRIQGDTVELPLEGKPKLVADSLAGSFSVTLDDVALFGPGSFVVLRGARDSSGNPDEGQKEYHTVASVTGATVTFTEPLGEDFLQNNPNPDAPEGTSHFSNLTLVVTAAATVTPTRGDRVLTVNDTAAFTAGDYVQITDDTHTSRPDGTPEVSNYPHREITEVKAVISPTQLRVAHALHHTYSLAAGARVVKLEPVIGSHIKGAQVTWSVMSEVNYAFEIQVGVGCSITDCRVAGDGARTKSWKAQGFRLTNSLFCMVERCIATDPASTLSANGYGATFYGATYCMVRDCSFSSTRHAVLFFNGAAGCTAAGCTSEDCAISDYDLHGGNCTDNLITDCVAVGGDAAADDGSTTKVAYRIGNTAHADGDHHNVVEDCVAVNMRGNAFEILAQSSNNVIRGCTVNGAVTGMKITALSNAALVASDNTIENCIFKDVATLANLNGTTGQNMIRGLTISGCTFIRATGTLQIQNAQRVRVRRCTWIDPAPAASTTYAVTGNAVTEFSVKGCDWSGHARGVKVTSCPAARITWNTGHDQTTTIVLEDAGGNTGLLFRSNEFHPFTPTAAVSGTGPSSGTTIVLTPGATTSLVTYPDGSGATVVPRPVWIDVRDKGAIGDRSTLCTTAIQAAIDEANAAGGGTVVFPDGWWRAYNLVLKSYVTLMGLSGTRPYLGGASGPGARGGAIIEAPPGITGGWVIDTPAANSYMMAIRNLGVKGSSGGGSTGGIRFRDSDNGLIEQVSTYWTGAEGIYLVTGNCNHLSGIFPLGALMARPTTGPSGAIRLGVGANDNTLEKWEASTFVLIGGEPSDSNLYNASLMVEGGTNFIFGGQAELSDVGLRVTGIQNKFIGLRADNNAGHGIVVAGNRNLFIGCQSLNNGYLTNTYDGFRCEASVGHGNVFSGCMSNRNDGKTNRYSFSDDMNNGLVGWRNQWVACQGNDWGTAEFNTHSFLGSGPLHSPHPIRPVDGTAVIDVTGTTFVLLTAYATPTLITNFTGGTTGQTISIVGSAAATIANNANIQTSGGTNKALASGLMYEFTYYSGKWRELASGGGSSVSDPGLISATVVTASRSLAAGDAGHPMDVLSPTPVVLTVPTGLPEMITEVAWRAGGQPSIAAGAGATLSLPPGLAPRVRARNGVIGLRRCPDPATAVPAGALLDLDPDTVAGSDGAAVTTVTNAGSLSGTIAQATSTKQPTLRVGAVNGHKAIEFDGTTDCLALGGGLLDLARNRSVLTVYAVADFTSVVAGIRTLLGLAVGTGSGSRLYLQRTAEVTFQAGGRRLDAEASSAFITSVAAVPYGTWFVLTATYRWSSSDAFLWRDGTLLASSTSWLTDGATSNTASSAGAIGSNAAGSGEFWYGRLGRLLAYGADHSTAERAAVHSMLQARYGPLVADYAGVADEWLLSGDLDST